MANKNIFYLLIMVLDLFFIVAVIFFERKNATATMAWVLILVFIPIVGFIAYLFIGNGYRINKKKRLFYKGLADRIYNEQILNNLDVACPTCKNPVFEKQTRLLQYLKDAGDGIYTVDNKVDTFLDGRNLFAKMLKDMRQAKRHIHLSYYIFRDDALGQEIINILIEKAKQGVEVRVIYDSLGSLLSRGKMFYNLREAGGETVSFSPVFFSLSSQFRLNYRYHRKITVIDGLIAYVGGMNIGVEYRGEDKRLSPWRDTHLRITGSSVHFLQERFIMDWSYANDKSMNSEFAANEYFFKPEETGEVGLQIISGGPDIIENPIRNGFLEMIYSARRSVYIQTPYFVPDESLLDALGIAAKAGVDVRLMIPGISDHWLVFQATKGFAKEAIERGVKVYQYNGFLHAKTIVCDGLVASVGSTNFNYRSLMRDFEINAFIYDQGFARFYEAIFLEDQKNCLAIDMEWYKNKSFLRKGIYNFTRLFGPIM